MSRGRVVLLLLLVLGLAADPLSHNHLIGANDRAVHSSEDDRSSLAHPICPVCASGNIAVLQQAVVSISLAATLDCSLAPAIAELPGTAANASSRAPPLPLF